MVQSGSNELHLIMTFWEFLPSFLALLLSILYIILQICESLLVKNCLSRVFFLLSNCPGPFSFFRDFTLHMALMLQSGL